MAAVEEHSTTQVYELEECKRHTSQNDCWLVINGKVYNVTDFLDEHPGGFDIILAATGKDATEEFEEIGHSSTAQEMLEKYLIGNFAGGVSKQSTKAKVVKSPPQQSSPMMAVVKALLPLLILAIAIMAALSYRS